MLTNHARHTVISCPLVTGLLIATAGLGAPANAQANLTGTRIRTLTAEQEEILNHLEIVYLDDGQGGTVKTIQLSGANLRIVNGLGATNGYPDNPDAVDSNITMTNGLGNLIVGYNEPGNPLGDNRTGSHNIVVGHGNSFESFGGFVGTRDNTISGAFASITGGRANRAVGNHSSVSGGRQNHASGSHSSHQRRSVQRRHCQPLLRQRRKEERRRGEPCLRQRRLGQLCQRQSRFRQWRRLRQRSRGLFLHQRRLGEHRPGRPELRRRRLLQLRQRGRIVHQRRSQQRRRRQPGLRQWRPAERRERGRLVGQRRAQPLCPGPRRLGGRLAQSRRLSEVVRMSHLSNRVPWRLARMAA